VKRNLFDLGKFALLLLLVVAVAVATLTGCDSNETGEETQNEGTQNEGTQNEGTQNEGSQNEGTQNEELTFTFMAVDADGVSIWEGDITTSETTVGAALLEAGLIAGEENEFGLMVTYVNDVRADFVLDDAWWAFYIDGEMSMQGVSTTDIEEGVTYAFVFTPN